MFHGTLECNCGGSELTSVDEGVCQAGPRTRAFTSVARESRTIVLMAEGDQELMKLLKIIMKPNIYIYIYHCH